MQSNSSDSCIHHYNVKIRHIFDAELQLINTKAMIKNKSKELLSELKKFKVQTMLVSDYKRKEKKRNRKKMIVKSSNQVLN